MTQSSRKAKLKYSIATALIFAAVFVTSGFFVIGKMDTYFRINEESAMIQNMRVIEGILNRKAESLSILATDWAMWNEMYAFAENPNQDYIESELSDQTFRDINTDIVVIISKNGDKLFSKQIYDRAPGETTVPELALQAIENIQRKDSSEDSIDVDTSIINIGSKKLIVTSRKITMSDGTGTPQGWVIFGRYIEEEFLDEFKSVPGFYFNVSPYSSSDSQALGSDLSDEKPFAVRMESLRKISGAKLASSFSPEQKYLLNVEEVPRGYANFINIIIFIASTSVVSYLITVIATIYFINRMHQKTRDLQ
jgi:sensor domain CHASE-containing protein